MPELGSLARLIRSKNAGPFVLTFDVMFDDRRIYRNVKKSGVLSRSEFARIYSVPVEHVELFEHDAAMAIKISIPRPYIQCDIEDGDAYGGQQHAPLVELDVPDWVIVESDEDPPAARPPTGGGGEVAPEN